MALKFYAPEGYRISMGEWTDLFANRDGLHHVTVTEFGLTVSTIWIGMSENNWEIAIIDDLSDGTITVVARLHCNSNEAKLFHDEWVSKANRGLWSREF